MIKNQMSKKSNKKTSDVNTIFKKIDAFEKQSLELNPKLLEKLNHDDAKEVYQVFSDLDDETSKEIVAKVIQKIKVPPIERARVGHRIWTYFYEKTILRIVLVIWYLQSNLLKKVLPYQIPLPANFDIDTIPSFMRKILLSNSKGESPTHLMLAGFLFFLGFVLIWLSWRIWVAYLESKQNKNSSGSTLLRRSLGIIVVNKKGEAISWLKSFARGLFRVPILNIFMIFSIESSAHARGLHDKFFGTYVLRINEDVNSSQIVEFIRGNYS